MRAAKVLDELRTLLTTASASHVYCQQNVVTARQHRGRTLDEEICVTVMCWWRGMAVAQSLE